MQTQVTISARHGHLADETQEYIREKVAKLTHHFEKLMRIEVTVDFHDQHDKKHDVEILVSAEHKHDFVARESHQHVHAAVDAAVHKLDAQIRKYKTQSRDNHRRDGAAD